MRFALFFLTLFFLSNSLYAQQASIELKNGNSIQGKILEIEPNAYTDIELSPGNVVRLKTAEIRAILFTNEIPTSVRRTNPSLEENPKAAEVDKPRLEGSAKGFYHLPALRMALARGIPSAFTLEPQLFMGFGFSYEAGYRFGPVAELGLGAGVNLIRGRQMIPTFLTGRFYLSDAPLSPFLSLSAGGNFGLRGSSDFEEFPTIERTYPGFYIYPAIGLQLPLAKGIKQTIDIGCSVQSAGFDLVDNAGSYFESDTYTRLSLRLGLLF